MDARAIRRAGAVAASVAVLLPALAGCGSDDDSGNGETEAQSPALPQGAEPVTLDPAEFTTEITNPYWPMRPGSRWVYRETDKDEVLKVVVTVTDRTKRIANGVEARVVHDVVSQDGEPVEVTDDWYAQDSEGNVWYLGEDTAEFENGKLTTRAGSFEAGVDGAQPGVIMPADPADDMRYRQEYYKGEAEDNGEILSVGEQVEVPAGHFEDALMTKDTNALEPKVLEFKLYAPGVGPVLALGVSGGGGREELIEVSEVGPRAAEAAGTAPLGEPYL
jgi:hypothetical protein